MKTRRERRAAWAAERAQLWKDLLQELKWSGISHSTFQAQLTYIDVALANPYGGRW